MAQLLLETHHHPKFPRLKLDLRADSRFWQARMFLDGKVRLKSTKVTELPAAFRVAEVWYRRELRASDAEARAHPLDRLAATPTIGELFAAFLATQAPAKRDYFRMRWAAVASFWRAVPVDEVTAAKVREYYATRRRHKTQLGEPPTNSTLAKDVSLLRSVLRFAVEERHLEGIPPIPRPGKIPANPRPWLTREEFTRLLQTAQERIWAVAGNRRLTRQRTDLWQFVIVMVESMMRVGELRDLTVGQIQFRDTYAIADVHGKRGHRQAVIGGGALDVLKQRVQGRQPGDRVFPIGQRDAFAALLKAAGLEKDVRGGARNLKALRCTGISFRVIAGAPMPNLLAIARQAGTSVAMIDQFYAKRLGAELFRDELSATVLPELDSDA